MSRREAALLALIGFVIWLSGAVGFRFAGALMFESGLPMLLLSAGSVAVSVCLLLNAVMAWRKAARAQALTIAVVMTLPGLFGDVAYILNFSGLTGLRAATAGPFAAVLIFGTAVLLGFALLRAAAGGGRTAA